MQKQESSDIKIQGAVRERIIVFLKRFGIQDPILLVTLTPLIVQVVSCIHTSKFDIHASLIDLATQFPEPLATADWREVRARVEKLRAVLPQDFSLKDDPKLVVQVLRQNKESIRMLLDLLSKDLVDEAKGLAFIKMREEWSRSTRKGKEGSSVIDEFDDEDSDVEKGPDTAKPEQKPEDASTKANQNTPSASSGNPASTNTEASDANLPKTLPFVHHIDSFKRLEYERAAQQAIELSEDHKLFAAKLHKDMEELFNRHIITLTLGGTASDHAELERYEFFGDSTLQYEVSRALYKSRPFADSRMLKAVRGVIVSNVNLAKVFDILRVSDILAKHNIVAPKEKGKADYIEALIGEIDYILKHQSDARRLSLQDIQFADSVKENIISFAMYIGEQSYLMSPLHKKIMKRTPAPSNTNEPIEIVSSDDEDDKMDVDSPSAQDRKALKPKAHNSTPSETSQKAQAPSNKVKKPPQADPKRTGIGSPSSPIVL